MRTANMHVRFTCALAARPGSRPLASHNGHPKRSCAPRSHRRPIKRLNRPFPGGPDLPDDLPLVKRPLPSEVSYVQIVQSITRGIE